MQIVHAIMAVLAAFRFTELVQVDLWFASFLSKRSAKIQQHTSCIRCLPLSVGLVPLSLFFIFPYANWPFGISSLFIMYKVGLKFMEGFLAILQDKSSPKIIMHPDGEGVANLELIKTSKAQAIDVMKRFVNREVQNGM